MKSVCPHKRGVQLERSVSLLNSPVVPARQQEHESETPVHGAGERLKAKGAFAFGIGLLVSPHQTEIEPEKIMRGRVARVEFDGSLEFLFSSREIALIPCIDPGQRRVGFPQSRV